MPEPPFEAFVAECLPALSRYAYKLTRCPDAAQDLVQDTLVKLAGSWKRIRIEGNPIGYAQTTMIRVYVSRWRMLRRRPQTQVYEDDPPADGDGYTAVETRDTLRRILRDLPNQQRVVLVLTYVEDRTDEEIAELLHRRPATIRSVRYRALSRIRSQCRDGGNETFDLGKAVTA